MATERARSLELCALGLGQAGGNLAAEFNRLGYRAAALNTARVDLRGLDAVGLEFPPERRLYIGLDELDGAGKDPDYGKLCLEEHAGAIRNLVTRELADGDALVLCAGLGGGTGSCISELAAMLEPLQIPLLALATLPSEAESGIVKVNAVRAASALVERPFAGRLIIDNQRIIGAFGDVDVLSYYPQVNREILAPLHALNVLNMSHENQSLRSFDSEDLRKVLLSSGVLVVGSQEIDQISGMEARELLGIVRKQIDGGRLLAAGLPLDKVAYLGAVLVAPAGVLKETPARALEELGEQLKKQTAGAAIYLGLYQANVSFPILHLLAGSMSLPDRVRTLLTAARDEGHLLVDKIRSEIPGLDVRELAQLQLFKPVGKPRSARLSTPPTPVAAAASPRREAKVEARVEMPVLEPVKAAAPEPKAAPAPRRSPGRAEEPASPPIEERPAPPVRRSSLKTDAEISPLEGEMPETIEVGDVGFDYDAIGSAHESLQSFYSQQISRFREAADRRGREQVARRLIHDARSDDTEVRAHAVWAMVSLGERGFKSALQQAVQDPDDEVRGLAVDGLRRLGESVE
ncbi:MAG: HEAT repeat domain-containing protein [Deltaproteobacteria bacterium]|nr:HEAT repeat domain-containing protein [Deltaproteobacteria bacterium]